MESAIAVLLKHVLDNNSTADKQNIGRKLFKERLFLVVIFRLLRLVIDIIIEIRTGFKYSFPAAA